MTKPPSPIMLSALIPGSLLSNCNNAARLRLEQPETLDYIKEKRSNVASSMLKARRASRISVRADPKRRLRWNMSRLVGVSLKSGKMGQRLRQLVDWDIASLTSHLEKKFHDGMSWDNYGAASGADPWWSVDHRKSIWAFGYPEPGTEEFRACWSLDNIQPMWHRDNSRKSNRW